MLWRAVVPLKGRTGRKTRLAPHLTPAQRTDLTARMFAHVLHTLRATPGIAAIAVLSDRRPPGYTGALIPDRGRGLNAELAALATPADPRGLLVIHADLPTVQATDIAALLAAANPSAATSCAIAPDRHATGTNALALRTPAGFAFRFGPGSLALHAAQCAPPAALVTRPGLSLDIDTIDDLALWHHPAH